MVPFDATSGTAIFLCKGARYDYGKMLHLPENRILVMRNLPARTRNLKILEDNKIYQKRLELRKDARPILHDGPP